MVALSAPQELPFDTLDKLLSVMPGNLNLESIDWSNDKSELITLGTKYVSKTSDSHAALALLETDLLTLQRALPSYNIESIQNSNAIMNHGGLVSIPLQLIITKKEE